MSPSTKLGAALSSSKGRCPVAAIVMATIVAVVSLLIALVALVLVRRQGRRIAELTDMYWQLRYDHGELKSTVTPPAPDPPAPPSSFVPLGSVKRSRP